jgi:hypothetical protein
MVAQPERKRIQMSVEDYLELDRSDSDVRYEKLALSKERSPHAHTLWRNHDHGQVLQRH